jgi:hypothetical protein
MVHHNQIKLNNNFIHLMLVQFVEFQVVNIIGWDVSVDNEVNPTCWFSFLPFFWLQVPSSIGAKTLFGTLV